MVSTSIQFTLEISGPRREVSGDEDEDATRGSLERSRTSLDERRGERSGEKERERTRVKRGREKEGKRKNGANVRTETRVPNGKKRRRYDERERKRNCDEWKGKNRRG